MSRKISWTNNSIGHSGTYVYRAPTLDPQALPEPVATVDPVAQGAAAEWIDNDAPFECYAVQDFDGQGVGTISTEVCVANPLESAQIGDEIGGGLYAGIDTIDGTDYHIISGLGSSTVFDVLWKTSRTATAGTSSDSDGLENTLAMQTAGLADHPAAAHCLSYQGGGFDDWHMPALSQLRLIYQNLSTHPEYTATITSSTFRHTWSSTESIFAAAFTIQMHDGEEGDDNKDVGWRWTVPIRRVSV